MSVSSLREITIGVADLKGRIQQFETGCGLSVLASGALDSGMASRLFDTHAPLRVAVLGRPDVQGSPRIRMVELADLTPSRPQGIGPPGPLGVGFTVRDIATIHARLETSSLRFVSPPLLLTPMAAAGSEAASPGPQRFEAFGRGDDGDYVVLIERVHAETPYGNIEGGCSEPLHASFIVTNLDACLHFLSDVLEHETLIQDSVAGAPFDALLGLPSDVSFRFAMLHRRGFPTGRTVFMEFARNPHPMAHTPGLGRGICRLRYDTTDLHLTLTRVPGGGGSLVRGPASVDDPILGKGMVAMVRAPFGVIIELWQLV